MRSHQRGAPMQFERTRCKLRLLALQTMKHIPGFVSANIHRSLDGKKIVNYAQWESMDAFEAMRKNPKAGAHMQAAAKLAKFEPILCEVSDSISIG